VIWVNGKKIEQDHFSAGELKIKLFGCGKERMDIVWHYENDAELFTIMCIRDYYANHKAILYIPYLPHARMDRVKNPEDVFTLRTFARVINSMDFERVYVWDAHSNVGPALIDRCHDVNALTWIEEAIKEMSYPKDYLCLFFPDEGAQKRYGGMFPDYKQAFGIKNRNWETGKIEGYMIVGEDNVKDNHILIIDDICSYGNTFVKAAEALHEAGANGIDLYVTHCEEAVVKGDVFKCGLIDKVFTTDSLVRSEETNSKLTIV
jgi:ribose-phosphate pyrophosphokinase